MSQCEGVCYKTEIPNLTKTHSYLLIGMKADWTLDDDNIRSQGHMPHLHSHVFNELAILNRCS